MGVRFVGLREILDLPDDAGDCVTMTIDDGHHSSWAVAFPLLQEYSVPAVFYIIAGKLDDPEYVNSDQIQKLHRHGMLIGSHTVTHRHLPLLTDAEVKWELQESRAILEEVVKDQVVDLAIPGGHFNPRIIKLAQECGYETVATCNVGAIGGKTDPMRIPRVEIRKGLTADAFAATFSPFTLRRLQILEFGKACMRRTLGLTTYDRIRVAAHRLFSIKR
jgi:peptidoglycan/xylan/chitin deacetylase (PgdA/CDA1 family)